MQKNLSNLVLLFIGYLYVFISFNCCLTFFQLPLAECSEGWYCTRGAWSPTPAHYENASLADSTCMCVNETGGRCQPGYYCPTGSPEPTLCTSGIIHFL